MAYQVDRDSFLTGLAAGRALWQPPGLRSGLWTCDPGYWFYAAGTDLGYSAERHFYKERDGFAVGFYETANGSGPWHGPVLISTDPDAVRYYYGSTHLTKDETFQYLGLTWYANWEHHYRNPRRWGPGSLRTLDCQNLGYADIMEIAGVRLL